MGQEVLAEFNVACVPSNLEQNRIIVSHAAIHGNEALHQERSIGRLIHPIGMLNHFQ